MHEGSSNYLLTFTVMVTRTYADDPDDDDDEYDDDEYDDDDRCYAMLLGKYYY